MKKLLLAAVTLLLCSCAVGPNYRRPGISAPEQFRYGSAPNGNESLANTKWFDLFQDEVLNRLVKEALTNNFDLRIASERVLEARASLGMSYTQAGFSVGWELDVWGRIRRLTESARAQYLASEEARRGVTTTLISDVSSTYFQLRELDLELEISRNTRDVAPGRALS